MKNLFFNTVFIFAFTVFASAQVPKTVSLESEIPYEVVAGEQFEVKLTITKPDFIHYATFKQKIPEGFKAIEKESGTAIFNFENNFITFKWITLPRAQKVVVTYTLIPTSDIGKSYPIAGTFKYLSNNKLGEVSLVNVNLKIMPKTATVKYIKTGSPVANTQNTAMQNTAPTSLNCIRTVASLNKNKEFIISLKIQKTNLTSTAKLIENIPAGYTARELKSVGSVFEFKNGQAIFLWNKLPKKKI